MNVRGWTWTWAGGIKDSYTRALEPWGLPEELAERETETREGAV